MASSEAAKQAAQDFVSDTGIELELDSFSERYLLALLDAHARRAVASCFEVQKSNFSGEIGVYTAEDGPVGKHIDKVMTADFDTVEEARAAISQLAAEVVAALKPEKKK